MSCPAWLCRDDILTFWQQRVTAQPMLRLAFYCAAMLALFTAVVMLQVVLLADLGNRRARKRSIFNDTWRPFLALCSIADDIPASAPRLKSSERLWWLLQWNRVQQQLRGPARARMNQVLASFDMEPYVLGLLRGGLRKRLVALTCLRYFGNEGHWDAIAPLLANRNALLALAAARTLIAIDAPRAMATVLPMAKERHDWALPRLATLCQIAGQQAVTAPLLTVMYAAGELERARLAILMTSAEPRLTGPWARAQLDRRASADLLQVALRCLGRINDPRDRLRVRDQLTHTDPNVRLVAVQTLLPMAEEDDNRRFIGMLSDRSWWVRQAAADAIASLPGFSSERLAELMQTVPDRYGQDALRRVIAERRE